MTIDNQSLVELTVRLREQYESLDSIIEAADPKSDQFVDQINEQLKAIKETETLLAPLREDARRIQGRLEPNLQRVTDETIELIKGLMPKLAQLEKTTMESAKRLFPKIQDSVRGVQMQAAYRTSARS